MRNCFICNEPIILSPSAAERARKYGKTVKYYENLFTVHDKCNPAYERCTDARILFQESIEKISLLIQNL